MTEADKMITTSASVSDIVAELRALWRERAEANASERLESDEEVDAWCGRESGALDRLARSAPQSPHELAEKLGAFVEVLVEECAHAMSKTEIFALSGLVDDAKRIAAEFQPLPSRRVH